MTNEIKDIVAIIFLVTIVPIALIIAVSAFLVTTIPLTISTYLGALALISITILISRTNLTINLLD